MHSNQLKDEFVRTFGLQWHITDRCDQRCKHCYIWRDKKRKPFLEVLDFQELNLKTCYKIVDDFSFFCEKFKVNPVINITGGDPILFPFFWEILEYLKEKNIPFRILGNPFHLNYKVCRRLKELGCIAYQLSLDGLQKTHDFFRKEGSFESTLKAIDLLKAIEIRVVILSTVSRLNHLDIPKLTRIVVDKKVEVYDFARYCPNSDESNTQLLPQEYKAFLSKMWEIFK